MEQLWVKYKIQPDRINRGQTEALRKPSTAEILAAAANLDGAEPDYEAAELLFEPGADLHWITSERLAVDALVRRIVDAALAGRKVLPEATR